jgi:hypothetical protein
VFIITIKLWNSNQDSTATTLPCRNARRAGDGLG